MDREEIPSTAGLQKYTDKHVYRAITGASPQPVDRFEDWLINFRHAVIYIAFTFETWTLPLL